MKYLVVRTYSATWAEEVEASSPEEALKLAKLQPDLLGLDLTPMHDEVYLPDGGEALLEVEL